MSLYDPDGTRLAEFLRRQRFKEAEIFLRVDVNFAEQKLAQAQKHPVLPNYLKRCERNVRKATAALAAFILTK